MSRFLKIYPGVWIDDCTTGITEISPDIDQEGWPIEGAKFIRFECFKIRALETRNEWNEQAKLFCVWPPSPVYLARGHRHSLREIFWDGLLDADEETADLEHAQPFLTGYIDDNGASEIRFETQPVYVENRSHIAAVTDLLNHLYDIASELLPDFQQWQKPPQDQESGGLIDD